jgi:hypothetical protein
VDFDGVLHDNPDSPWEGDGVVVGGPVAGAFAWLGRMVKEFEVNIVSSRSKSKQGRIAMQDWCKLHGLDRAVLKQLKFPEHKPAALIYIDDRGYRFTGTFPSASLVRKLKPWNRK